MLCLAIIVSCICFQPAVPPASCGPGRYRPGSLIVGLDPDAGAEAAWFLGGCGARLEDLCPSLGLARLRLEEGAEMGPACERLRSLPWVSFAGPEGLGRGGFVPNDTYFGEQWHHPKVETTAAWEITRGSKELVVAVLDSGIDPLFDPSHPEFFERLLPGEDFVEEDDPAPYHPHGVYVTGLLAANAGNGFGGAGIDQLCRILPVRVLDRDTVGTEWALLQGLAFAVDRGARVINLSLSNYPESEALSRALQYAREHGVVLVACAGNLGAGDADVSWPGASPLCISVGATDRDDRRAGYSGTGQALDLVAPGDQVCTVSASPEVDEKSSFSGCSAAVPIVAGVASLLLAAEPALTPEDVQALLELGAEDGVGGDDVPGWDRRYGWGRVNARRSLELLRIRFVRGDANGDQALDISDAIRLLTVLFLAPQILSCGEAADANDDGRIDIADPTTVLNFLFLNGELPGPYPACGFDRTPDGLGCATGCERGI